METDNVNNAAIEIRRKERILRSSKSRSMTPVTKTATNGEEMATAQNDISSTRHSTGRKVVTSSSKLVSKSKTISGKTNMTVIVETNSSQEKSTFPKDIPVVDESVTRLSSKEDSMELRSERQIPLRQSNRSVANGTGREETAATSVSTRVSNRSMASRNRATRLKTSDYSSDDDDLQEEGGVVRDAQSQRVLDIYQGEFWNKLPKTDFTYSPVSKDHYKEVAPGVSVKPNMSRHTYQQYSSAASSSMSDSFLHTRSAAPVSPTKRLNSSKATSTFTTTSTRRSRFFDANQAGTKVPAYIQDYGSPDSDVDEVDTRVRAEAAAASAARSTFFTSYFTTFFMTIWTVVTTTWTTTIETTRRWLGLQNYDARVGYTTPVRRTITRSRWGKMLDLLYLLPAYITSADLSLLTSVDEGGRSKRLKLFSALMLLLLLLLCGWWLLYTLGLEETASNATALLADTWTVTRGWIGTLGTWCRMLGGWIIYPLLAAFQAQREHSPPPSHEYEAYRIPPLTVATTPAAPTPATFEFNAFIARLLESDEFEAFMASRLGQFTREDLVKEILSSSQFTSWIALKTDQAEVDVEALTLQVVASGHFQKVVDSHRKDVDVASLVAEIWATGHLQQFMDAHLDESKRAWLGEQEAEGRSREAMSVEVLRASWQQTLEDKSKYFEGQNAELAGKFEQLKEEFERKLNASMSAIKGEFASNEELKRTQEENMLLKARLETCCNKTAVGLTREDVERHVLRYIAGMYGLANTEMASYAEIQALMGNMFVGKQHFEAALANVTAHHKAEMREVSEQSAQTIMDTISERISDEFASHQKLSFAATAGRFHHSDGESASAAFVSGSGGLTDGQVLEIVNRAIMTYDADKTGMVDYALESSGGSVISTRCTESYYKHTASMTLFGIPYWYPVNTPRTVIQPGVHPGECWAFRGSQGFLVIQLAGLVRISSFSLEHIPRSLAFNGNIDSAPKDFSIWGLEAENDLEPTELGKYTYLKNSTSLQYFLVKRTDIQPFKIIELRIDSNHGNLEYTCLYRFRVHGTWVSY